MSVAAGKSVLQYVTLTAISEKVGVNINILANLTAAATAAQTVEQSGTLRIHAKDFIFNTKSVGNLIGSQNKTVGNLNNVSVAFEIPADANTDNQQFNLEVYPSILSLLESSRKTLVKKS